MLESGGSNPGPFVLSLPEASPVEGQRRTPNRPTNPFSYFVRICHRAPTMIATALSPTAQAVFARRAGGCNAQHCVAGGTEDFYSANRRQPVALLRNAAGMLQFFHLTEGRTPVGFVKFALAALLVAMAMLAPLVPASANDSEAEWALGGLAFKANDAISMDSEDLYLSAEEVKVDYTYTNHSDADQAVLVSFPLPAFPNEDYGWWDGASYPDWQFLEFRTTVDGREVAWDVVDRALAGGKDVTALVAAEGMPLRWWEDYELLDRIEALPAQEVARLVGLGLLGPDPEGYRAHVPAWQAQRVVTREQVFPAKATVRVSHRYRPQIGGSVGGLLHQLDDPEWAEQRSYYEERYCVDPYFLGGVKRRQAEAERKAAENDGYYGYGETWLGYVLSTGANWRGPIKDFRLVVDKGRPENLVSFCMDGVTKISPTQFEVRRKNFEPVHDLNILIVQWYAPED